MPISGPDITELFLSYNERAAHSGFRMTKTQVKDRSEFLCRVGRDMQSRMAGLAPG